eukprot:Nk52_evm8s521 gene=Nk52_evmTU8s521
MAGGKGWMRQQEEEEEEEETVFNTQAPVEVINLDTDEEEEGEEEEEAKEERGHGQVTSRGVVNNGGGRREKETLMEEDAGEEEENRDREGYACSPKSHRAYEQFVRKFGIDLKAFSHNQNLLKSMGNDNAVDSTPTMAPSRMKNLLNLYLLTLPCEMVLIVGTVESTCCSAMPFVELVLHRFLPGYLEHAWHTRFNTAMASARGGGKRNDRNSNGGITARGKSVKGGASRGGSEETQAIGKDEIDNSYSSGSSSDDNNGNNGSERMDVDGCGGSARVLKGFTGDNASHCEGSSLSSSPASALGERRGGDVHSGDDNRDGDVCESDKNPTEWDCNKIVLAMAKEFPWDFEINSPSGEKESFSESSARGERDRDWREQALYGVFADSGDIDKEALKKTLRSSSLEAVSERLGMDELFFLKTVYTFNSHVAKILDLVSRHMCQKVGFFTFGEFALAFWILEHKLGIPLLDARQMFGDFGRSSWWFLNHRNSYLSCIAEDFIYDCSEKKNAHLEKDPLPKWDDGEFSVDGAEEFMQTHNLVGKYVNCLLTELEDRRLRDQEGMRKVKSVFFGVDVQRTVVLMDFLCSSSKRLVFIYGKSGKQHPFDYEKKDGVFSDFMDFGVPFMKSKAKHSMICEKAASCTCNVVTVAPFELLEKDLSLEAEVGGYLDIAKAKLWKSLRFIGYEREGEDVSFLEDSANVAGREQRNVKLLYKQFMKGFVDHFSHVASSYRELSFSFKDLFSGKNNAHERKILILETILLSQTFDLNYCDAGYEAFGQWCDELKSVCMSIRLDVPAIEANDLILNQLAHSTLAFLLFVDFVKRPKDNFIEEARTRHSADEATTYTSLNTAIVFHLVAAAKSGDLNCQYCLYSFVNTYGKDKECSSKCLDSTKLEDPSMLLLDHSVRIFWLYYAAYGGHGQALYDMHKVKNEESFRKDSPLVHISLNERDRDGHCCLCFCDEIELLFASALAGYLPAVKGVLSRLDGMSIVQYGACINVMESIGMRGGRKLSGLLSVDVEENDESKMKSMKQSWTILASYLGDEISQLIVSECVSPLTLMSEERMLCLFKSLACIPRTTSSESSRYFVYQLVFLKFGDMLSKSKVVFADTLLNEVAELVDTMSAVTFLYSLRCCLEVSPGFDVRLQLNESEAPVSFNRDFCLIHCQTSVEEAFAREPDLRNIKRAFDRCGKFLGSSSEFIKYTDEFLMLQKGLKNASLVCGAIFKSSYDAKARSSKRTWKNDSKIKQASRECRRMLSDILKPHLPGNECEQIEDIPYPFAENTKGKSSDADSSLCGMSLGEQFIFLGLMYADLWDSSRSLNIESKSGSRKSSTTSLGSAHTENVSNSNRGSSFPYVDHLSMACKCFIQGFGLIDWNGSLPSANENSRSPSNIDHTNSSNSASPTSSVVNSQEHVLSHSESDNNRPLYIDWENVGPRGLCIALGAGCRRIAVIDVFRWLVNAFREQYFHSLSKDQESNSSITALSIEQRVNLILHLSHWLLACDQCCNIKSITKAYDKRCFVDSVMLAFGTLREHLEAVKKSRSEQLEFLIPRIKEKLLDLSVILQDCVLDVSWCTEFDESDDMRLMLSQWCLDIDGMGRANYSGLAVLLNKIDLEKIVGRRVVARYINMDLLKRAKRYMASSHSMALHIEDVMCLTGYCLDKSKIMDRTLGTVPISLLLQKNSNESKEISKGACDVMMQCSNCSASVEKASSEVYLYSKLVDLVFYALLASISICHFSIPDDAPDECVTSMLDMCGELGYELGLWCQRKTEILFAEKTNREKERIENSNTAIGKRLDVVIRQHAENANALFEMAASAGHDDARQFISIKLLQQSDAKFEAKYDSENGCADFLEARDYFVHQVGIYEGLIKNRELASKDHRSVASNMPEVRMLAAMKCCLGVLHAVPRKIVIPGANEKSRFCSIIDSSYDYARSYLEEGLQCIFSAEEQRVPLNASTIEHKAADVGELGLGTVYFAMAVLEHRKSCGIVEAKNDSGNPSVSINNTQEPALNRTIRPPSEAVKINSGIVLNGLSDEASLYVNLAALHGHPVAQLCVALTFPFKEKIVLKDLVVSPGVDKDNQSDEFISMTTSALSNSTDSTFSGQCDPPKEPKDATNAFLWLCLHARKGDAHSQMRLGSLYLDGMIDWSSTNNNANGLSTRPRLRANIVNVEMKEADPGDIVQAFKWFLLAARQRVPAACTTIGWLMEHYHIYSNNVDHAKGQEKAKLWYQLGASLGCPWAQYNLAIILLSKKNTESSFADIDLLLSSSFQGGCTDAKKLQATFHNLCGRRESAIRCYAQIVDEGGLQSICEYFSTTPPTSHPQNPTRGHSTSETTISAPDPKDMNKQSSSKNTNPRKRGRTNSLASSEGGTVFTKYFLARDGAESSFSSTLFSSPKGKVSKKRR